MIPDPKDVDTFNAKYLANMKHLGYGEETSVSLPCPFCAEPGFLTYKILDVEEATAHETVCQNCGRGIKSIYEKSGNLTKFEIVQTCGRDPADYQPKMRRLGL